MQTLTIQQAFDLAIQHQQAGRLPEAQSLYRQILASEPGHIDALQMLAVLTHQAGKSSEAIEMINQAIRLNPNLSSCHSNLGMILAGQGKIEQAIASFRHSLAIHPDSPETLNNLGNALQASGQMDEAIASYRQAVAVRPEFAQAHNNLGTALCTSGRLDEGIAALGRAIAIRPDYAQGHFNLGKALNDQGESQQALDAIRRALALQPAYPEALNNLGIVHQGRGEFDDAVAAYQRALAVRPKDPEVLNNLGTVFQEKRQHDQAIGSYRRAIEIRPDYPEAHGNLANALSQVGQIDEALALYRRALSLKPQSRTASGFMLFIHLHPEFDARRIRQEHASWNETYARPLAGSIRPHENDPTPDRRLRIGYVSPDFTEHPVGRFMLPLLANHDHGKFEIICYSDAKASDANTQRLRSLADVWRETARLTDEQLAELVREDRIDILVDLLMHAKGSRMLAFARKPAPVQLTYLSYCSTTGLETMDYRLSDPYLDPPGMDESVYIEKTVRLPNTFWCFQPSPYMPEVGPLPARANGCVTFGCMNNFWKVTPPTLSAWFNLLLRVPSSRLIVHAHEGSHRQQLRRQMEGRGIDPRRIQFVSFQPMPQYFEQFNRIDIGLDPFPFGGGTTTCETLWMGVPVVSMTGSTAVSRAGLSILSNIGLPELVAQSPEEYVEIAASLPRLAELRSTMRERMRSSPLMDAPKFAKDVEDAYRAMWRSWCKSSDRDGFFQSASGDAHSKVARAPKEGGDPERATATYHQAGALSPDIAQARYDLANRLFLAGRFAEAIPEYQRVIFLRPDFPEGHNNLGLALKNVGRPAEAMSAFRKAVELRAAYVEALSNLAMSLGESGQLDEALAACRRALASRPNYALARMTLGNLHQLGGELDEAIESFRQAEALDPQSSAADSLLYALHFHPGYGPREIWNEHVRWNLEYARALAPPRNSHNNDHSPNRRLRIGYVSPDFRDHSQSFFTLPLFSHHDHDNFEIFCYSDVRIADELTARLRGTADVWRDAGTLSHDQLADVVRQDRIDILVDLTLHMSRNRLLAFARKPAPVQVTWLGYPGTTGLDIIDYRLSDPYLDPPRQTDEFYSERTVRLPHSFWCYDPLTSAPEVSALPALHTGFVTFACLNGFYKITALTLQLWAKVLARTPRSRLVMLAPKGDARSRVLSSLERYGIDAARIEFCDRVRREKYLDAYRRIDLCLDPIPCPGHTTTFDALWMGVATVTLVGATPVARGGLSILSNIGLRELVAQDPGEYVEIAANLAADLPRLAELRSTMRQRMKSSPLMDAPRFAKDIEDAYRAMWRNWCASLQAPTRAP